MGEHTGTHFDAPAHWITRQGSARQHRRHHPGQGFRRPRGRHRLLGGGRRNRRLPVGARAYLAFEEKHGRIPPGSWLLMRTDWSKRKGAAYANMQADGAHTPGPSTAAVKFMIEERDVSASASSRSAPTPARRIHSRPCIPPTACCMAPDATVCNACAISTSCRRRARWSSPRL